MFGKEVALPKGNTSVIAKGLFITGNLNCEGILEIEGKINGDINGNVITLRENSSVTGNITAKIINIRGEFNGIVKSERINISGKANIKGTLEYVSLCVEDGASIEGDLKRISEVKFNKNDFSKKPEQEKESKNNDKEKEK